MNWLKGDGPLELWLTLLDIRLTILDTVLGIAASSSVFWAPYLITKVRLEGWAFTAAMFAWMTLIAAASFVSYSRGYNDGAQFGLKVGANTALEVLELIAMDPKNQDITVAELARRSKAYAEQNQAR